MAIDLLITGMETLHFFNPFGHCWSPEVIFGFFVELVEDLLVNIAVHFKYEGELFLDIEHKIPEDIVPEIELDESVIRVLNRADINEAGFDEQVGGCE